MKFRLLGLVCAANLLAMSGVRAGSTIDHAVVGKGARFDQTGDGLANVNPNVDPYQFNGDVQGGDVSASFPAPPNVVIVPGAANLTLIYNLNGNQNWQNDPIFPDKTAFDAAFPNGNYTFDLGNHTASISISLTGDAYPNTPFASFDQGTWSGGTLFVDPTQSLTITTNAFTANFTSSAANLVIDVDGIVHLSSGPPALTDNLSYTIAANTLTPGQTYDGFVLFQNNLDMQSPILGGTAVAYYSTHTNFVITAIPEPSTTVLAASAAAFGCALLRRHTRLS